jgi:hypothetical protein
VGIARAHRGATALEGLHHIAVCACAPDAVHHKLHTPLPNALPPPQKPSRRHTPAPLTLPSELDPLAGYRFYQGKDSGGGDLPGPALTGRSAMQLARICNANAKCVGAWVTAQASSVQGCPSRLHNNAVLDMAQLESCCLALMRVLYPCASPAPPLRLPHPAPNNPGFNTWGYAKSSIQYSDKWMGVSRGRLWS